MKVLARSVPAAALGLILLLPGCAARKTASAGLAEELPPLPPELSVPLEVREMQVVAADGRHSAIFRLSRLPDGVEHRAEADPPRIVVAVKGPTGNEGKTQTVPGGDALIAQVHVTPRYGRLELVLELQGKRLPDYEVRQMADWVVVTLVPQRKG